MKLTTQQKYILAGVGIGVVILIVLLRKGKKNTKMEQISVEKTWDPKTDAQIQKLHPNLRGIASKFINEVEKKLGKKLRIASGLRTFDEQNALYAKGRTAPGTVVTRAKGGESYHNYGLAFDVYYTNNGSVDLKTAIKPDVAKIGQELGLEWGGSWKTFKDMPHFQLTKGTTKDLLALHNNKKVDGAGYVLV
jgi:peptidoglycan L-alanyl-D-glutamate endopeptidase CwlK